MAMLNFSGLGAPEGTLRLQHALFPRLQHQHALTPHAHQPHHRLLFSPFCASKHDFLTLSGGADVFLDNLFYNAGTTGSDVLFAGLPVLTSYVLEPASPSSPRVVFRAGLVSAGLVSCRAHLVLSSCQLVSARLLPPAPFSLTSLPFSSFSLTF